MFQTLPSGEKDPRDFQGLHTQQMSSPISLNTNTAEIQTHEDLI